jgi:hypothetical protein
MSEMDGVRQRRIKTGGRQTGTPNRVTADIRAALRDLAEGNAHLVQQWLDRVAADDPAEALRLWLALLRFVTPTLQAAAIADITPKSTSDRLAQMSNEELMEIVLNAPRAAACLPARIAESSEDDLLR